MLSDFDLAKQSGHPGGRPATIHQSEPNGVRVSRRPCDNFFNTRPLLLGPYDRYDVVYG